ncbi:hypothetical protein KM043_006453 [Ampulex compressa]|nr:hypothetical protein KM043_006453 [Ampulex compressa]
MSPLVNMPLAGNREASGSGRFSVLKERRTAKQADTVQQRSKKVVHALCYEDCEFTKTANSRRYPVLSQEYKRRAINHA